MIRLPWKVMRRIVWLLLIVGSFSFPNGLVASESVNPTTVQNVSEVRAILLEFRDTANGLEECPDKAQILRRIAAAQAEAGDLPEAVKTVAGITDARQEVRAWADIWFARAMGGDEAGESLALRNALQERDAFTGQDWSEVYEILLYGMHHLLAAGRISAARRAAAAIPESPDQFSPHAQFLYALAQRQLKTGAYSAARATLVQLLKSAASVRDERARSWLLMKIGESQAEAGDGAGAQASLHQALEAAEAIQDSAHATAAKNKIAEVQKEAKIKSAVAKVRVGDVRGALEVAQALPNTSWVVMQIAEAQAKLGDVHGALETIGGMPGDKYRALFRIAKVQAGRGDLDGALETAAMIEPNPGNWGVRAYENIARAQAKAGDLAGAQDAWRKAAEAGRQYDNPSGLVEIAKSQAKAGDVAGALRTAAAIAGESEKSRALTEIVEAQATAGDVPGAIETASGIADASKKAWASRDIAAAQAKANDVDSALATAAAVEEPADHNAVLGQIARARAEAADVRSATKIATNIEDASWKSWALMMIAQAQLNAGDRAGALGTLQLASDASEAISGKGTGGYTKAWALFWIAEVRARAGDLRGALETAAAIRDKDANGRPWVLSAIAQIQATAAMKGAGMQDVREALRWAGQKTMPDTTVEVMHGALQGLRGEAFQGMVSYIHGKVFTISIVESPDYFHGSFVLLGPQ